MIDVILDTLLDSVKLIPFLYLTYLAMEFLEQRTGAKARAAIQKGGKLGPAVGGVLGVMPQCGFSAAASNLYAGRVITVGTLIAVYLSTSDEMLPIFISEEVALPVILKILGIKVLVGMLAGILIDLVIRKKEDGHDHIHELCEHDHCHCGDHSSVWRSALNHTVRITIFLVLISFALNTIIFLIGEDALANLLLNRPIIGQFLAGMVGLIPNCAASVVITQLYLQGAMSFGAMMSGLLVGAGVGLLVLFRANSDKKDSMKIVCMLYVIGVFAGILIELLGITV